MANKYHQIQEQLTNELYGLRESVVCRKDELKSLQAVDVGSDIIDRSTIYTEVSFVESGINRCSAKASSIEFALQRIKNGTYGVCNTCGIDIPLLRLKVSPFALECVDCLSLAE
ncbi:TraR/DksA family transcriptional regulator [Aliivibrio fischeri]|uniref:TraR/DksA family transcriptional regulator n=1 Tax=Aliivibrio fischeri TaxID=668 RepID=UPI0012D9952E|nr:TraR/DksA family transcriptional regulator [Aliivibrio fischeri]MUJ20403.1 hypothetical protein [Aliivibrio fischeri]